MSSVGCWLLDQVLLLPGPPLSLSWGPSTTLLSARLARQVWGAPGRATADVCDGLPCSLRVGSCTQRDDAAAPADDDMGRHAGAVLRGACDWSDVSAVRTDDSKHVYC